MTERPNNRMSDRPTNRPTDRMTEWLNNLQNGPTDRQNDRATERKSKGRTTHRLLRILSKYKYWGNKSLMALNDDEEDDDGRRMMTTLSQLQQQQQQLNAEAISHSKSSEFCTCIDRHRTWQLSFSKPQQNNPARIRCGEATHALFCLPDHVYLAAFLLSSHPHQTQEMTQAEASGKDTRSRLPASA